MQKIGFFKRIKFAITKFEKYDNFSKEKLTTTLSYLVKIILIFTLILSVVLTWKYKNEIDLVINKIANETPNFTIENNELNVESEEPVNLELFNDENILLVLDSSTNIDLNELLKNNNKYNYVVFCLKDKIVLSQGNDENVATSTFQYDEFLSVLNVEKLEKQDIFNYVSSENMYQFLSAIYIFLVPITFIMYTLIFLMDIILLSILAWILVKLYGMKLSYKNSFNIAVYALTLPIILELIYLILNLTTGFTIKYFDVMYNLISYVYMFAVIFIIKINYDKTASDMMPVVEGKIEQEEKIEEETNEDEKKEEDKDIEKEKDKEKKGPEPEPGKA